MRERDPKPSTKQDCGIYGDPRIIPVRQLLNENGQARLEHAGDIYLLRITRNGKLILTK